MYFIDRETLRSRSSSEEVAWWKSHAQEVPKYFRPPSIVERITAFTIQSSLWLLTALMAPLPAVTELRILMERSQFLSDGAMASLHCPSLQCFMLHCEQATVTISCSNIITFARHSLPSSTKTLALELTGVRLVGSQDGLVDCFASVSHVASSWR